MWAVVLTLLKIIGLILLWTIIAVIALVLIFLLAPVKYTFTGQIAPDNEEEEIPLKDRITAVAKITYLFHIVRADFAYPEPGGFKAKVLFFTVLPKKKKDKKEKMVKESREKKASESSEQEEEKVSKTEVEEEPGSQEKSTGKIEEKADAAEKTEDAENGINTESSEGKEGFSFDGMSKKITYKIRSIYDKIRTVLRDVNFYKALLTNEDTGLLVKNAKRRILALLKAVLPRRIHADLTYGLKSPDLTGYAFAVYSLFAGRFDKTSVVDPDFDREVLEGQLQAKGHFNLWTLGWHAALLYFDKRLKLTRQRIDNHKESRRKYKEKLSKEREEILE